MTTTWYSDDAIHAAVASALAVAEVHGQVDGAHHKAWVIDQMVRALTGPGYGTWVRHYEASGEYEWSEGVAP